MEGASDGLILRYDPSMCLEGLRRTTKNITQDSWSLDEDFNLELSKYEAGMVTTWHLNVGHSEMTDLYI